jgi:glutamate carboxypeptidase
MNSMSAILSVCCLAIFIGYSTNAEPSPNDPVYKAVEANRADTVELLKTLVNIDSGSEDVEGAKRIQTILAEKLTAIGGELRYEPAEAPNLAPNLVAVFKGTGTSKILIIAHIDTVFAAGDAAKRRFTVEGTHASGPGVGDEKAGVVNAVMALKILHDLRFNKYGSITLLLDGSEELASPGSTELIKKLARQNDVEFNMEPGDPPDAITVWRKGGGQIAIDVRGRAAHAGMEPQNGRNAAVELIHQLAIVENEFPHSGNGITVNLTVVRAGDRTNVIPDAAEAILDVRYRDLRDFDGVLHKIQTGLVAPIVPDTTTTVRVYGPAFPPLTENRQIDGLASRAQSIYAELGKTLAVSGNGGGSESAIAMTEGTPSLDGLGYVGSGFHTDHEWIDLSSIAPRLYLFTRLLEETSVAPSVKSRSD